MNRKKIKFFLVPFFVFSAFVFAVPMRALAVQFAVFEKSYVRQTGKPVPVTDSFTALTPSISWKLRAINGSLQDKDVEKVSSSTSKLNGVDVLQPKQFNQNTSLIEVPVTLKLSNTIVTELRGKPGGRLTVSIVGEDDKIPAAEWLSPTTNQFFNTANITPKLKLTDEISGIDPASLQIRLDNTSVVNDFTALTAPTLSATLQANLQVSEGPHVLFAQMADLAQQPANASVSFTVDLTKPVISNIIPVDQSTIFNLKPNISADYSDALSGIDTNTVRLLLDNVDVTAQSIVGAASVSFTPASDLSEGLHTVKVEVKDKAGNLQTAQSTFTSLAPEQPPVLDPIGNRSVDVGTTLTINLSASDPNNDPLTFSASPLPLPDNASLNATSGKFTFQPSESQVGQINLTFIVSDGTLTDQEAIIIDVSKPPATTTSISGRILDTTDFVDNNKETPVVNATVSLLGTNLSIKSDATGRFKISGVVASTSQILDINPATANLAPDGSTYAGFREEITIVKDVNNVIDRPFFLPRIDASSKAKVNPTATTMVVNSTLGITLEVPPFTAKDENNNNFTGDLSISKVPDSLAPAALPPELDPGLLITIQPVGVRFATPVPITFPNIDNLTPGSEADIWSLDAISGTFVIVGTGKVSADRKVIETISGGVRAADWHFALASSGTPNGSGNNDENQDPPKCTDCGGSSWASNVAVSSGNLSETHDLASYRSLGQSRSLQLVYNSLHADPRPVISANLTVPVRAAVPPTVSTRLSVARVDQGFEVFTDTSGLDENIDETIRQVVQFDASALATGRYPYELMFSNNYTESSVSSVLGGNVLVNNQKDSPFGAGWTLDGLHRLRVQSDGSALITEGDGSILFFRLASSAPGLRAYWPFDDKTNPTKDIVGAHDGFLQGSPTFTSATIAAPVPKNSAALSFNSEGDHVSVNNAADLNIPANLPMTIALWVKQTEQRDVFHVLSKRQRCDSASNINYHIARDITNNRKVSFVSANQFLETNKDFTFNQWTHFAVTYDGISTVKLYFDGVEVVKSTNFVMGGVISDPMKIGDSGTCPAAQTFPGQLDEVYFYHKELTPAEILALKNGTISLTAGFLSPDGDFSTLVKNNDGTFTRTMKDGTKINFNAQGLQTSWVDRNGNTTTYAYDANGRLAGITDPANLVTTFNYTNGLLVSITDPAGRITTFNHDSNGNLTRITDPDNESRLFEYDAKHHLISQTSKRNLKTTYEYNFAGRNVKVNRADGFTREILPKETIGLVDLTSGVGTETNPAPVVRPENADSIFTDGNGNTTKFETDRFGAATVTTDALGRQTTVARDDNSNPTQITQPSGAVTIMTYDEKGNLLTSTEQAIGATTTFTYEAAFNQVTSIKDPNGSTTTMTYDTKGNPLTITDADNNTTTMTYNAQGLVTSIKDVLNNTTTFTYDTKGNLIETTNPLGFKTTLINDAAGNVIRSTDAEGKITEFTYDALNRLTQVKDANTGVTTYTYDESGNLTQVRDARTNITVFAYDPADRLIKTTDPLGRFETFTYDDNGNLTKTIDRKLQTINFEYDAVNQLVKKILPGNLVTTFAYDTVGNLTVVTDPDSKITNTYDLASRLTSTATTGSSNQPNVTISYTYDKNGNRLTMTDSGTNTTNYTYDALNRLTSIKNPFNQTVSFTYDVLSRRTGVSRPNGVNTSLTYDAASQLTNLMHKLGTTTLSSFGYTYDKVGNRTALSTQRTGVSVNSSLTYTYDNLFRLTQATNPLPLQSNETFTYDAVGNRLKRDGQLANAVFDAANRLLGDDDFTYVYDNNGNLASKTNKSTSKVTAYIYDAENQLIEIKENNIPTAKYRYDGLGRRIEKDVGGTITRYVYDNEDILLEFNGSNVQQARYTHGAGVDEPLVMDRGGQSYYYHTDGLDSIVDLTNNLGAIVQSYVYDSFGNIILRTGSLANPYTYTGRELDTASGLYFYRARYYDPNIGRFLSEDPLDFTGGDLNLYNYVLANPINNTDPSGEQVVIPPPIITPPMTTFPIPGLPGVVTPICSINPSQQQPGVRVVRCTLIAIPEVRGNKKICRYSCEDGSSLIEIIPATSNCDSVIFKIRPRR